MDRSILIYRYKIEIGKSISTMIGMVYPALTAQVRHILRSVWDPCGLGSEGPIDEYDAYIAGVVALIQATTVQEQTISDHLRRIEVAWMGLSGGPSPARTRAARGILGLWDASKQKPEHLAAQLLDTGGLRCLWVFRMKHGSSAYEEAVLRRCVDENGTYAWWATTGRSGLFETASAAEAEARAAIEWLRFDEKKQDSRNAHS